MVIRVRGSFFLAASIWSALFVCANSDIFVGFYDQTCPKAEEIIFDTLKTYVDRDGTLTGPLLRMTYHDCFVRGCDASILLDSINGQTPEKEAPGPNLNSLRGYEVYDGIKSALESACPGVVSCADIIQLVGRDVTVMSGGPSWAVPTGRRDGVTSSASEALANLVGPDTNYDTQKALFERKSLSEKDLVVLSGAHTIGRSRCEAIENRLYKFGGAEGATDPSLDEDFAQDLKRKCPSGSSQFLSMDGSSLKFDVKYFERVQDRKGLFVSDAALITQRFPASLVGLLALKEDFFHDFPSSMVRMSRIGVLEGSEGQIRKHCAFVNR